MIDTIINSSFQFDYNIISIDDIGHITTDSFKCGGNHVLGQDSLLNMVNSSLQHMGCTFGSVLIRPQILKRT